MHNNGILNSNIKEKYIYDRKYRCNKISTDQDHVCDRKYASSFQFKTFEFLNYQNLFYM